MSRYIDYDAIDYRNDRLHDKSEEFLNGVIYMAQRIEEAPSIDICAYGKYCMCATCFYQNDCSNCADCISNNKQIHDIWSCTKYMRKEHLRKGADDA